MTSSTIIGHQSTPNFLSGTEYLVSPIISNQMSSKNCKKKERWATTNSTRFSHFSRHWASQITSNRYPLRATVTIDDQKPQLIDNPLRTTAIGTLWRRKKRSEERRLESIRWRDWRREQSTLEEHSKEYDSQSVRKNLFLYFIEEWE